MGVLMKRFAIFLLLSLLIFTQSCGKDPTDTGKEKVALPEPAAESYGADWAYAKMDKQIPADDLNFSVTGEGFVYRDGWLGAEDDGYFDLAVNYEPGSDEKFSFEFDMFVKDKGTLWLGLWLYGKDSMPDDGIPGEWIKLKSGYALYGSRLCMLEKKDTFKIQVTAGPDGFTVYADGIELISMDHGSQNGGGAIKLRSEGAPVYVSNVAFRLGN